MAIELSWLRCTDRTLLVLREAQEYIPRMTATLSRGTPPPVWHRAVRQKCAGQSEPRSSGIPTDLEAAVLRLLCTLSGSRGQTVHFRQDASSSQDQGWVLDSYHGQAGLQGWGMGICVLQRHFADPQKEGAGRNLSVLNSHWKLEKRPWL